MLLGTKATIYPGSIVRVNFTFARAGTVTVPVPVRLASATSPPTLSRPPSSDRTAALSFRALAPAGRASRGGPVLSVPPASVAVVPKSMTAYRCGSCGAVTGKWYGRCPKCGEFSTLVEQAATARPAGLRAGTQGSAPSRPARPVSEVVTDRPAARLATGIGEFDRVLGGGLVPGQVCLCSGPPGSGKSTLLLAVADSVARPLQRPVLYVSGEESVEQIALRAQRIGSTSTHVLLADDTDLSAAHRPHRRRGATTSPSWSSTPSRPSRPATSRAEPVASRRSWRWRRR